MMALPDFDRSRSYGLKFPKFSGDTVFLVYPTGAVRVIGPDEWAELASDGTPLIECTKSNEEQYKAVAQEAWTSRGYVRQPGS